MYLGNIKKRIRYSVVHPLGQSDLPNQMSEEELHAKTEAHKQGDDSVKDDLILGHVRLTLQICGGYVGRYPHKKDDIVSAAMLGLVKAVDRAREHLDHDNISGYITLKIHSHISDYLKNDKLIRGPADLVPYTMSIANRSMDQDAGEYYNDAENVVLPPQYDEDDIIINDFLNQLPGMQRKIVELKLMSYTNNEIAKRLGVSTGYIWQILLKVQEKLRKRL